MLLRFRWLLAVLVVGTGLLTAMGKAASNKWKLNFPVLNPGPPGSFDETAVKDPSVVHADGEWHVFYTARGRRRYSLGYVAAKHLEELNSAPRVNLFADQSGKGAVAAPEVFFFRPQKKWYLVFQTSDSNYQPVFSTTSTIGDPSSWSAPALLVKKDDAGKWIDFWVICDREKAYLFYTRNHTDVMMMSTALRDFPAGFSNPLTVFTGVHEAVHVYRETGAEEKYAMLFELQDDNGWRRFRMAEAEHLSGPWHLVEGDFASADQLTNIAGRKPWTRDISHGELLRKSDDERVEADVKHARFLIQALPPEQHTGDYAELPWRLFLISRH